MEYVYFDLDWRSLPLLIVQWTGKQKDVKCSFGADWPALKSDCPQGQLPILKRDGLSTLCQSGVIHEYLAAGTALEGAGEDKLRSQMLCLLAEDLLADMARAKNAGDWKSFLDAEDARGVHKRRLHVIWQWLENKQLKSESSEVRLGDLAIFDAIQKLCQVESKVLDHHPRLSEWFSAMSKLEACAFYLKEVENLATYCKQ